MTPNFIAEITRKLNEMRVSSATEAQGDIADLTNRIEVIREQVGYFNKAIDESVAQIKNSVDGLAKALIDFEEQRRTALEARLKELNGDAPEPM